MTLEIIHDKLEEQDRRFDSLDQRLNRLEQHSADQNHLLVHIVATLLEDNKKFMDTNQDLDQCITPNDNEDDNIVESTKEMIAEAKQRLTKLENQFTR